MKINQRPCWVRHVKPHMDRSWDFRPWSIFFIKKESKNVDIRKKTSNPLLTRMHSNAGVCFRGGSAWSRGGLLPGGLPSPGGLPGPGGWCLPGPRGVVCSGGCLLRRGLPGLGGSARGGGWCVPACTEADTLPPVDRILDTRLWKYYLGPTSLQPVTIIAKYSFQTRMHSSGMPLSPSMHCAGGGVPPPEGVPAWGVYLPRGLYLPGGYLPRGNCPGGCTCPGYLPRYSPRGQNSWHTLLKILPCPNFIADGN